MKVHAGGMRRGALVAAAFFAALLPLLSSPSRWRHDERYYTDGALHMARTGDYLTPHDPRSRGGPFEASGG